MCNQDYAHDVQIFPDEKIMKRNKPTKPSTSQDKHVKCLETYLNDFKKFLTTYQGFKIHFVILKILGKY